MPGGRCRVMSCASWSWRPGWPGPPAVGSSCGRWSCTCAAARSDCARVRRSSTAWPPGSPSASSPSRASGPPCPSPRRRVPVPAHRPPTGPAPPSRPPSRAVRSRPRRRGRPGPTRYGRATHSGASHTMCSATAPIGRRSPRSTSGATSAAGRASWTRTSSARDGVSAFLRRPMTGSGLEHRRTRQPPGHLPELLALGLGSVACAAFARRAGRRRRLSDRFAGDPIRQPSEGALDAATLLERFAGTPALHSFEAANCMLGRGSGGSRLPPTGSSNLCLALRRHLHVQASRPG